MKHRYDMETKITSNVGWAARTGLLPIHLVPSEEVSRFIMLDGGVYDFCLDFSRQKENFEFYKSLSWSANTKNYICVNHDKIIVYNWLKPKGDVLPATTVEHKFDQFINILNASSVRTSSDVMPFVINLFRSLRNETIERKEPIEALNLLYRLLISLEEDNFSEDVCRKWNIRADIAIPSTFDNLVDLMRKGSLGIKPNLDLILRHGSGMIFQEAHRIAQNFSKQLSIFGGYSSNIDFKSKNLYSSTHYTPQYLARSIVENCIQRVDLSKQTLRILDPACGSGSFLIEALKQLKEKNYCGQVIIEGLDSSVCAVSTTQFLLNYEKRAVWSEENLEVKIKQVSDSLQEDWDGGYDIILMNPPFVSMELLKDPAEKDAVRQVLAELSMSHRPNQAAAFLYKAIKALAPNGCLGAVLPYSILLFDQYERLREAIHSMSSLQVVAHLGNFVFENALTDVSFMIFTKKADQESPQVIWCRNKENVACAVTKAWRKMSYNGEISVDDYDYNIYTPGQFPLVRHSWKVIQQRDEEFMRNLKAYMEQGLLKPLSSVLDVKQGLLRGNKYAFILNKDEYENIPQNERMYYRPLASSDTIKNGHVVMEKYIWYPYDEDGLMIKSEEELKSLDFSYGWLSQWRAALENREGVSPWWSLTRPRKFQYSPNSHLISKRFGNSSSFAITAGDEVVEEGNALLLKSRLVKDDMYFYLSVLSSGVFDRLLSIFAKPLLSGYDLGGVHIKDIPVPDVRMISGSTLYQKLVETGQIYHDGDTAILVVIDDIVKHLYPQVW